MRPRIKNKVSITKVVKELDHKKQVYTNSIKSVMLSTGKNYTQAKKQLTQELKFKAMQRELKNI